MRYQAVVKGGFWPQYSGNLSSIKLSANDFNSTRAVQSLSKKGSLPLRELIDNLVGSAPGGNVRFRYAEIAPAEDMGGKRTINETNYLIDRPSTAADVAIVKAAVTEHTEVTHTVDQAVNLDKNPLGTR